jgi:hypothetical protein
MNKIKASIFAYLILTQIFSAILRQSKSAFQCPTKNLEQMLIADARRLFLELNKNILKNMLLLVFIFFLVDSGHKSCKKKDQFLLLKLKLPTPSPPPIS